MQPLNRLIFEERIQAYTNGMHPVVPLQPKDKLLPMDFTATNKDLTDALLKDTDAFGKYVTEKLTAAGARYGVGGYDEDRVIYRRSGLFGPSPNKGPHPGLPPTGEGADSVGDSLIKEIDGEFYWDADASIYKALKVFALQLRHNATPAEGLLWQQLRGNKLSNHTFRRQHIIGPFIADFVCLAKKLIVELDGAHHSQPEFQVGDENRTFWLNTKGYTVIRFTNEQVMHQTTEVLSRIKQALHDLPIADKKLYSKQMETIPEQNRPQGSFPQRRKAGMGAVRSIHLGLDIWGPAGTAVHAPLAGTVHSFAFNDAYGDYGATLILQHQLDDFVFHSLYGHLSLSSIQNKKEGQHIRAGETIAWFGVPKENGHWPPHLHFQIVLDMQDMRGDYPGVCTQEDRSNYLNNCPNPALLFPAAALLV